VLEILFRRASASVGAALIFAACAGPGAGRVQADSGFAATVARLSESGGYFDTDNLISNEASYLHAVGALRDPALKGGVYIGVGPDQNFSYIAQLEPRRAVIVDIRRDNMLLHLLFKSLFALSDNRLEYLRLLFGRPPPAMSGAATDLAGMLDLLDTTPPTEESIARSRRATDSVIARFGVPLTDDDRATIDRFHRIFITAGPDLRFTSFGRPPRAGYPSYRELLLERDLDGRPASYVASEQAFRVVRDLQRRNLVIPIVGDFAGPHALRAVGDYLRERGEEVTAFYTSNVEFYLFRDGGFQRFVENARSLPRRSRAVVIRSVFRGPVPRVAGYYSAQVVQPLEALVTKSFTSYWELVTSDNP